jgi:hypothetical protein
MIINTEQIQELLDSENISTNQIQDITGFARKNVWMYKTGRTQLMKMQLQTLIKLQECYNLTHDNIMRYKNFTQVIDVFNSRFGQTEIYLDPGKNELKILKDGILGDIKDGDIEVYNKSISNEVDLDRLLDRLQETLENLDK